MSRHSWGLAALIPLACLAQADPPTPVEFFGHEICADNEMIGYEELVAYWQALAASTGRLKMIRLGTTSEGQDQWMAVVSDPANLARLDQIRAGSRTLALARSLPTEDEARRHVRRLPATVWLDGGIHSTEALAHQQLAEAAFRLTTRETEENRRFLRDCLILLPHINPDGHRLVADWFNRRSVPAERSMAGLPRLYQKYAGHDNNRDWYQMNLLETRNVSRALYHDWFPQLLFNHHQTSPAGTIMYLPPFRDPYNTHIDPIIQTATEAMGAHLHQRLVAEGKAGTVMRDGAGFSAWWNGGLRTTAYFHNIIGILSETFGTPNPSQVPFRLDRQLPSTDLPMPAAAGPWRWRQSLEYVMSANDAMLDYASRNREKLLLTKWRAARNSIERGSRDSWTRYHGRLNEHGAEALSRPDFRDPRAFVVSARQTDFGTAQKFLEILRLGGVEVRRIEDGERKGDWVVFTDQAYRPHILDMFEPQDHPNKLRFPGGPPIPPYDTAGYTPALQMGVAFDRLLDRPDLKTSLWQTPISADASGVPGRRLAGPISQNDSHGLAFRALAQGLTATRTDQEIVIEGPADRLQSLVNQMPAGRFSWSEAGGGERLKLPKVALLDVYGGRQPIGWASWMLDHFGIPFEAVYPPQIDRGDLTSGGFDAILIVGGLIPARDGQGGTSGMANDPTIPFQLRRQMGAISVGRTVAELRRFAEAGGHVLAIGSSAARLAEHFELPVVTGPRGEDGRPLSTERHFVPGSLMRLNLNRTPLTAGLPDQIHAMVDESPSFKLSAGSAPGAAVGEWRAERLLSSGWALGEDAYKGSAAMVDLPVGSGRTVLYGPEAIFRGQQHAAFKLIFNALWRSAED